MREVPGFVAQKDASKHELYVTYRSMLLRCYYPSHGGYRWYGAKGVRVCLRWRRNFFDFVSDMGPRPDGHQLERRDRNGDYEPENVRWASKAEQALTNSRTRRVSGTSLRQAALARGLDPRLVGARLRLGWSEERALSEPPRRLRKVKEET